MKTKTAGVLVGVCGAMPNSGTNSARQTQLVEPGSHFQFREKPAQWQRIEPPVLASSPCYPSSTRRLKQQRSHKRNIYSRQIRHREGQTQTDPEKSLSEMHRVPITSARAMMPHQRVSHEAQRKSPEESTSGEEGKSGSRQEAEDLNEDQSDDPDSTLQEGTSGLSTLELSNKCHEHPHCTAVEPPTCALCRALAPC